MDVTGGRVWRGDRPCFLVIVRGNDLAAIDLDEPEWPKRYADVMRGEATWHLFWKGEPPALAFSLVVHDGEQPYYTSRNFGRMNHPGIVTAYGIGKKRLDGHVDRLWAFTDGQICTGDDVDAFGSAKLGTLPATDANPPEG